MIKITNRQNKEKKSLHNNIILVGMPGAGKSTLGVLIAKVLGMDFVDTDILIQQYEKKLLQNIINDSGIDYFLRIEEKVVSSIKTHRSVIATGGSVIYSEKAMNVLKKNGLIVYLSLPFEEIEARIKDISSRGVVIGNKTLRNLYDERKPLYEQYSDITVDCQGKSIEKCVEELVRLINK